MPVDVAIALTIFGLVTLAVLYVVKLKGGLSKMLEDLEASQIHNTKRTRKHS